MSGLTDEGGERRRLGKRTPTTAAGATAARSASFVHPAFEAASVCEFHVIASIRVTFS